MKANIFIYLTLFSFVILAGCKEVDFKKTPGGMPYKIFKGKGGKKISNNNFIKINVTRTIEDSVLFTTKDKLPTYLFINPTPFPYDISELWTSLEQGDSIYTVQMIDTFMLRNPGSIPPIFKKGERILTYIKILDVFESDSARMVDEEMEKKKWAEQETAFMTRYIQEKKIKADKTPGGAYVEIINPGEGNLIDSGNYVFVKYTGISFSGVKFDSNVDTSFGHTEPLTFMVGSVGPGSMIRGFDECMKFLRKGSVAKIYIPSLLAYGPNPSSPKIKPLEHIMFEILVLDVKDKAPDPVMPK